MYSFKALDTVSLYIHVTVQYNDIKVPLSAISVSFPRTSSSGVLRGIGLPLLSTATLLVSYFGGLCDYRQFLIWWRLRSFVMIIAEFWPVIGCKRSMALDSPSVVWAGQTAFSSLNEAFPQSIHPFYPYSFLSLCLSLPLESVHQFGSPYIFFFPISADIVSLLQVLKITSLESQLPILDL